MTLSKTLKSIFGPEPGWHKKAARALGCHDRIIFYLMSGGRRLRLRHLIIVLAYAKNRQKGLPAEAARAAEQAIAKKHAAGRDLAEAIAEVRAMEAEMRRQGPRPRPAKPG